METSQNVTDRGSALTVCLVRCKSLGKHRIEDPSVNRLHAVTDIRKGSVGYDRHSVVNKRFPHLPVKVYGDDRILLRLEDLIHLSFQFHSLLLLSI